MENQETSLLIIDPQERLISHMFNKEILIDNIKKLIKSFNILKVPVILTEQYPKGLGTTIKEIKDELKENKYLEKLCFDCFGEKEFEIKTKNIVICGIEAHVCVFQTALSALKKGFNVFIVADAISSRKESDYKIALRRMEQENIKLATTEMITFQILKKAGTEELKEIQKIIK